MKFAFKKNIYIYIAILNIHYYCYIKILNIYIVPYIMFGGVKCFIFNSCHEIQLKKSYITILNIKYI